MKRIGLYLVGILFFSVLSCASAWAQATAQISGTVKDQSGAVLPGTEVTATQTETGLARSTVTNENGVYVLPNVSVGPYRLEAALPGFRTFVQTGIVLQVNDSPVIPIVLEVGQVSEQVEVQANAALVETRSTTVGEVIENARILELPLNGRNVTDLITLGGAAVQTDVPMPKNYAGANFISTAGGLGFGIEYTLDGARHVNFISGTSMQLPFPDALQEFKIETSGMTAQHGASASVAGVTKSGTNEIHGDLFEFVRNDLFNSRNYFATKPSTLKRNQFGGIVGGPVTKNRLFFFAGFQDTIVRQDPADKFMFIPTPAMMAGDWTAFASAACNTGRPQMLKAPFLNNKIDPSLYNQAAVNIINRVLAAAPTPDSCGQVIYGQRMVTDEGQLVTRTDYQWTAKHSVFGRFVRTHFNNPTPYSFSPNNILNVGTGLDGVSRSLALGETYLIGPSMVNAFRVSANVVDVWRIGDKYFSYCDAGIKTYCGYAPTFTSFSITGGFTLSSNNVNDNKYHPHSYALSDDVSLVHGTHQLSLGGSFMHGSYRSKADFVAAGTMTFSGQETGLGMGDFMLGKVTSLTAGTPNDKLALTQNFLSMYATDTWKAKPKLTVNYGLRWEPFIPQVFNNGAVLNFDVNRFQQGIYSSVFKNAPAGWYFAGDPGSPGSAVAFKRWLQIAPRLGLAWDPNGDGRMSIRASYAYSYNFVNAQWREDTEGSAPWGNRTTLQSVLLDDPWHDFPGGKAPFPLIPGSNAQFTPYSNMQSTSFHVKTPTSSSWNLGVQKQIQTSWLVSATYIGSEISHIWSQRGVNPAVYMPGGPCTLNGVTYPTCSTTANTNQRRTFSLQRPQDGRLMAFVSDTDFGATQSYNGLLLSLERRAAKGVTVSGNYTWSHCIGDYADINSQGPAADEVYSDPANRRADRGNCLGERRQIFNLTSLADTPRFANSKLRLIGTGWRFSGIYRLSSGKPFTVVTGIDRSLTANGLGGAGNQRVNQVLGSAYGDRSGRPMTNWLNFSAFAMPALGTLGNIGRNSVFGPKEWSFDMAVSRSISVRETQRVEFRAEAFNVTNSFRPGGISVQGPSGSGNFLQLNNPSTFGVLRNALDPRILQFALKYVF